MKKFILLLTLLSTSLISFALSPWLPAPRTLHFNTAFTYETANRFWNGRNNEALAGPIKVRTLWLGLDYGASSNIAVDFITGYTNSSNDSNLPTTQATFEGRADSTLSVRWRVIDEFIQQQYPTVTLRVAGTLKGTYERSFSLDNKHSPGDRVNKLEGDIIIGKQLPKDFAVSAELGYVKSTSPVPEGYIAGINIMQAITQHIGWNAGLRREENFHGKDISGSNFTERSSDFQSLREIKNYASAGVGYTTSGGQHIGFNVATIIGNNRNTKDSTLFSLSISLPLYSPTKIQTTQIDSFGMEDIL